MAQPKRRWSKARTHLKRSTWKLETPKYAKCSNCGYYDGKQIIEKKENND